MKLLPLLVLLVAISGCAVYRVENPKLASSISDPTRAEIVGWKSEYKSISGPDRVVPVSIDEAKLEDKSIDISETIHQVDAGARKVMVMYFGGRGNVVPKMFAAYAEIPLHADAGVRYQCRGRVEGNSAILWIVRLPGGEIVSDEWDATIGDFGFSGTWKPRK